MFDKSLFEIFDYNFLEFDKEEAVDLKTGSRNIVLVSEEININKFKKNFENKQIRGRLSPDFALPFVKYMKTTNNFWQCKKEIVVDKTNFDTFILALKEIIYLDLFAYVRLFIDELVPNVFLHTKEESLLTKICLSKDGAIKISVEDKSGLLDFSTILSSLGDINRDSQKNASKDSIKVGGHGLRLILNFSSFVYFCIIPDRLTSITGLFVPNFLSKGFIIENREDVFYANYCE